MTTLLRASSTACCAKSIRFDGAFGAVGPPTAGPQVGARVPAHVRRVRLRGLLTEPCDGVCVCYLHTHLALRPSLDSLATAVELALRRADPFAAKGVRLLSDLRRTYSTPRSCDTACDLFALRSRRRRAHSAEGAAEASAVCRNRVMNSPG